LPARGVHRQPVKFMQRESFAYWKWMFWWWIRCDDAVVVFLLFNLIVPDRRIRCNTVQELGYRELENPSRGDWQSSTLREAIYMTGNIFGFVVIRMLFSSVQKQCQLELSTVRRDKTSSHMFRHSGFDFHHHNNCGG
jgi:hypothetical protein